MWTPFLLLVASTLVGRLNRVERFRKARTNIFDDFGVIPSATDPATATDGAGGVSSAGYRGREPVGTSVWARSPQAFAGRLLLLGPAVEDRALRLLRYVLHLLAGQVHHPSKTI
jgi:hypothetical protein